MNLYSFEKKCESISEAADMISFSRETGEIQFNGITSKRFCVSQQSVVIASISLCRKEICAEATRSSSSPGTFHTRRHQLCTRRQFASTSRAEIEIILAGDESRADKLSFVSDENDLITRTVSAPLIYASSAETSREKLPITKHFSHLTRLFEVIYFYNFPDGILLSLTLLEGIAAEEWKLVCSRHSFSSYLGVEEAAELEFIASFARIFSPHFPAD
jgi:hypothetical protein